MVGFVSPPTQVATSQFLVLNDFLDDLGYFRFPEAGILLDILSGCVGIWEISLWHSYCVQLCVIIRLVSTAVFLQTSK